MSLPHKPHGLFIRILSGKSTELSELWSQPPRHLCSPFSIQDLTTGGVEGRTPRGSQDMVWTPGQALWGLSPGLLLFWAFPAQAGQCNGRQLSRQWLQQPLYGPQKLWLFFYSFKKEKKFLQVEQSLCWIWEMLFLVTDKGNYLRSASSFSLISLLLCEFPRAASLSMSRRTD